TPSADALAAKERARGTARQAERDRLLALLRGGPEGVKKWNARQKQAARVRDFRRVDLSGAKLKAAVFPCLDLTGAQFDGAVLTKARFEDSIAGVAQTGRVVLKGASFRNADLRDVRMALCGCSSADFTGARLNNAHLRVSNFSKAVFREADLRGADVA